MRHPRRIPACAALFAGAVAACAGFAGCTASLFKSKETVPTVYQLSAVLPATIGTPLPVDLAVQRPRLRSGLDTDRIAVLYPDRRLDWFAAARWSAPLDQVIQDLAVQALQSSAHLRTVTADSSGFASGYWLEIDVEDCQAEYATPNAAPSVHVRLHGRVGSALDRRVLVSVDARAVRAAADNRLTEIVAAYEQALDDALAQVVTATATALEATAH